MEKNYHINTNCVQAGYSPKNGEPRVLPIVQSTTYKYESSEQMGRLFDLEENGYFYTRLQNPTNDAVAARITALEGGVAGMLTSSGQAANFYATFNVASAGDHIVSSTAIYGGTFNLFSVTMKKLGIDFTFVRPDVSEEELNAAFRPNTKAVFAETLSNPSLDVLDIEKFAKAAHAHGVPLIVDNTFPTPINCRPFEFGADIVTHSTTKYMDGHATSVGGAIIDSGNFDWTQNDKFPGLTTPDESYHGVTYRSALAKALILPRPPHSSCATSAPSPPHTMRSCWGSGWKRSSCVCSGTVKMRRRWRNSWRRTKRSHGSTTRVFRATRVLRSRRNICRTARAAWSPSA